MYKFFKRVFDIILSGILIIVLSPIFLIIMSLLLLFNKGDIFYLQERIGKGNKLFKIMKFSTMLKNSPSLAGGTITLRNDPRVTPVGKFLRLTKLNELPQLINVLIGDMSFVGPRPLLKNGFSLYPQNIQHILHETTPGITGISSVIFRDEEKLVTDSKMKPEDYYRKIIFPYKSQLEKWYYENKSFFLDIIILFLTAFKIIFPSKKLEFLIFPTLPKNNFL